MFPQEERLFMVRNIKAVKEAYINEGSGVIDFIPTLDLVKPDIFVVNAEGGSDAKRQLCEERGIQYIELGRTPHKGLEARSSSSLKASLQKNENSEGESKGIPTRLDLAGTWIDQPYVSMYHPGWAITISLEPTFEVRDRCGLSTSTRKMIQKIWPEKIEICSDEMTFRFLEEHLMMIPMEPRKAGCSVVEGKDITPAKVKALADAADACWNAITTRNLEGFAAAYKASFEAQTAMYPGMIAPTYINNPDQDNSYISETIDRYSSMDDVLAWKMPGAGGGGYLDLVVRDAKNFIELHPEAFELHIRRE